MFQAYLVPIMTDVQFIIGPPLFFQYKWACVQRLDAVVDLIETFHGDIVGSGPGIVILLFSKFRIF